MIQLFAVFNFNIFCDDAGKRSNEVVVSCLYRSYYPIGARDARGATGANRSRRGKNPPF